MSHKIHLKHTVGGGPTCQSGKIGGALRGEHFTYKHKEFALYSVDSRCQRCTDSKLFAFLERQAAKEVA